MATVPLVATTDPVRATQFLFETWDPALGTSEHAVLLPRTGGETLAHEWLQEIVAQLQQRSPLRIHLLVEQARSISRHWKTLAARLGVTLHACDQMADDALIEVAPGIRLPRILGPGAYAIEIVNAAALTDQPRAGLSLAAPDRFLAPPPAGDDGTSALQLWRPELVILDAVDVRFTPHRTCEVAALSDDRVAIDLVALGLHRLSGADGSSTGLALTRQPPFVELEGDLLRAALPLEFNTEGVGARELAKDLVRVAGS